MRKTITMRDLLIISFLVCFFMFSCSEAHEKTQKTDSKPKAGNATRTDTTWSKEHMIESVGYYSYGKLSSVFFFEKMQPTKAFYYLDVDGKNIPNELYRFSEKGDTLKDQSIYHTVYFIKDTISANEKYEFKVVLEGHLLDSAYLILSDVNKGFPIPSDSFSVREMKNFEGPGLAIGGEKKGWNYIRGRIDNFKNSKSQIGNKTWIQIFFVDSFYVK